MLTTCNLPLFIPNLSDCKQVELYTDFVAAFANFKSFCMWGHKTDKGAELSCELDYTI